MGKAYGFIEITGVVAAIDALDIMCKAADVTLSTWERKLGGRLVTLVIEGDVSAVRQAVEAGSTQAIKKPVLSRPREASRVMRSIHSLRSENRPMAESSFVSGETARSVVGFESDEAADDLARKTA